MACRTCKRRFCFFLDLSGNLLGIFLTGLPAWQRVNARFVAWTQRRPAKGGPRIASSKVLTS